MVVQLWGRRHGVVRLGRRLLGIASWLPACLVVAGFVGLSLYCRSLLDAAESGAPLAPSRFGFWLAIGGFLLAGVAVIFVQALRLAWHVAGPELRLCRSLQRIRSGDVGFRITLRRTDLLHGLARECNDLLQWLNENPPPGVRTGGDVVELESLRRQRGEQGGA